MPRTTPAPVVLTPDEAAERYRLERELLMRWARAGKCPSYKVGGLVRFDQGDMDLWWAAQRRGNGAA